MPSPKPGLRSRAGWRVRTQLAALSPARQHTAGIHILAIGFLPFTGPARHAVGFAWREARRLGHAHWGAGHLLLGLAGQDDGIAARAMERLGLSREQVRQQAGQITAGYQNDAAALAPRPAQDAIPAVLAEAAAQCDDHIGTGHLLLALFGTSDRSAAQALASAGAGEAEIRGAITDLLAEPGPEHSA
jgi:ATP-dependent Clp protease ATP-binding subunit ClpC